MRKTPQKLSRFDKNHRGSAKVNRTSSNFSNSYGTHLAETTGELLLWGKSVLRILGPRESRFSTERLLEEAAGLRRAELYLETDRVVSPREAKKFRKWIERRKKREPVAYIIKKAAFWEEVLTVNRHCLIPRPETEILVERFIDKSGFKKSDSFKFLDLGSGSGAIGIAILRVFPNSKAVFIDVSPKALEVTRTNLAHYHLGSRAETLCSDLFRQLRVTQMFDALVSNPPYFAQGDWKTVEPEIFFEPKRALSAGCDGLDFYREIAQKSYFFLKKEAPLFLEVGQGQTKAVKVLLDQTSYYQDVGVFKDLQGIDRVVKARRL